MTAVQRDEAWLLSASPEEIHHAHLAGELDTILTGKAPLDTTPAAPGEQPVQRDAAWIDAATPQQLAAAYDRGELRDYMAG